MGLQARLEAGRHAVLGAGAALLSLRGAALAAVERDYDQLKTAADNAAEGWVVGLLKGTFPGDVFIAEEDVDARRGHWSGRLPARYWTVDALDGTRSFAEGYDGFCVQVAYIEDGRVLLGLVYEPVREMLYWAVRGRGAVREHRGTVTTLRLERTVTWPHAPVFVDSKPPRGAVGEVMRQVGGTFLECGSIGLKICRVADGTADVFAKALRFKIWDVAPGELILDEAGGCLTDWRGQRPDYAGRELVYQNLIAAADGLIEQARAAVNAIPSPTASPLHT
jgi:fructose-1,6-bisphosphatase/inositol monophosphatase family enzyme